MDEHVWIATRQLTTPDGKLVEVSLSMPSKVEVDWMCVVRIVEEGEVGRSLEVYGIDAFQAISLALEKLRQEVAGCTMRFPEGFEPAPSEAGNTFFYRVVAFPLSVADIKNLDQVIDDAMIRISGEAAQRKRAATP